MRTYLYSVISGERDEVLRFHLYINAIRRFSLNELFAKQAWAMMHIEELPFNELKMASGAAREGSTHIVHMLMPYASAFRQGIIKVYKDTKTVELKFSYMLEFVFYDKAHVEPFLQLVKKKWKGDWIDITEENA